MVNEKGTVHVERDDNESKGVKRGGKAWPGHVDQEGEGRRGMRHNVIRYKVSGGDPGMGEPKVKACLL